MTSRAVIEEFWQRFLFVRGLPQSARWQDCFHFETTPAGAEHALGLVLQNQTEGGQGLYVLAVMENSAAQHMGLEAGDLLLSLDGVAFSSCDELDALLAASPASARLEFSLLRDSQQVTLSFVPQEGV